jgi:8-oxo-dGTP pyrophosphatase MutT (NUDIX family)
LFVAGSVTHPHTGAIGVVVALQRQDGRWLMIRRSRHVRSALKVCFPGGMVEPGESQPDAAIREMREELSILVRPIRQVWRAEIAQRHLTIYGWLAEMAAGQEIQPNEREVADVLWLTPEEGSTHPDGLPTNTQFLAALTKN